MISRVQSSTLRGLTVKSHISRSGRRPKNQLLPVLVQSVVRSSKVRLCQCFGRTYVFHRQRQLPRPLRLHEQPVARSRRQETTLTLWLSGQTLPRMVSRMVRRSEELFGKFNTVRKFDIIAIPCKPPIWTILTWYRPFVIGFENLTLWNTIFIANLGNLVLWL